MIFTHIYVLAVINMEYYAPSDPGHVNIYISGSCDTDVQLVYPWATRYPLALPLDASNDYRWNISYHMTQSDRNSAVARGIRIMATEAVTVQVSRGKLTLTNVIAYTAIPLTRDSTEFYLSARRNSTRGMTSAKPLVVVGTGSEPATVTIYKRRYDSDSVVYSSRLEAQQMREILADRSMGNLTGYYVTASAPVVVYSGHQCGNVPTDAVYCEPILQQIAPLSLVGREYIAGPLHHRGKAGYTVRVGVITNDTAVRFDGEPDGFKLLQYGAGDRCTLEVSTLQCPNPLGPGDYVDVQTSNASWPMAIHCSKPCYSYQFNHGGAYQNSGVVNTDPFMMNLIPTESIVEIDNSNIVRFSTVTSYSGRSVLEFHNFLNVMTRRDVSVSLDGQAVAGPGHPDISGIVVSDWILYTFEVTHGFHTVQTSNGSPVLGQVYGHGPAGFNGQSGYGYPASYSKINIDTVVYNPTDLTTSLESTTTTPTSKSTKTTPTILRSTSTPVTSRLLSTKSSTTTLKTWSSRKTYQPTSSTNATSTISNQLTSKRGVTNVHPLLPCEGRNDGPWSWLRWDMYIALGVIAILLIIVFGQAIAICVIKRRKRTRGKYIQKRASRKDNSYDMFPELPRHGNGATAMARYTSIDVDKSPKYDNIVNQHKYTHITNEAYDDIVPGYPHKVYEEIPRSRNSGTYDVPKGVYDVINEPI